MGCFSSKYANINSEIKDIERQCFTSRKSLSKIQIKNEENEENEEKEEKEEEERVLQKYYQRKLLE
jgi:hypothetical protein